jgi:hypothetical protein
MTAPNEKPAPDTRGESTGVASGGSGAGYRDLSVSEPLLVAATDRELIAIDDGARAMPTWSMSA